MEDKYRGYKECQLDEEQLANFYSKKFDPCAKENEYVILRNSDGEVVDKYCFQDGQYRRLKAFQIHNRYNGIIKPRNIYQSLAIDMLQDDTSPVKVLTGVYGSAKTFFMVNAALEKIEKGIFDKMIFVRNGLSPQGVPDIGYLPGSMLDKTIVWGNCIADHIGGQDALENFIEKGQLEIIPLNFIRGRDLKHSIIFSDESENLTPKLIQLLIGRIGEGSELWIAGDYRQTDLGKKFSEGLSFMIDRLKGNRLFSVVDMPVTERSKVAELSNLLD